MVLLTSYAKHRNDGNDGRSISDSFDGLLTFKQHMYVRRALLITSMDLDENKDLQC